MAKALPVLGIIGAVFAALAIAVFVPDSMAMFLPVVVTLVGAVVLFLQRSLAGVVAGLVVLALTVVAALGLVGNVSTEDGETNFAVSVVAGQLTAIAACLLLPVSAVVLRWDDAQPRWLAIGPLVMGLVGFLIIVADPDRIAEFIAATLTAAVLCLLALVAMVPLLRADPDERAPAAAATATASPVATPLASSESTVGKPSAGKPAPKAPAKAPARKP